MTISKRLAIVSLAGTLALGGLDFGERLAIGSLGFVSSAEARVGRPLTPVSVAGVARRTVRRCAVGVYNC
jgi:hypothetical protein